MTTINDSPSHDESQAARTETNMQTDSIWFCPSRWLLAHHDPQANISTMSSHLCLADLNNDGENLLALVDFKPSHTVESSQIPYQCRMRVYRGKHLIYNHFLDDLPCCMVVTSNRTPLVSSSGKTVQRQHTSRLVDRLLLTLPINDDIYFYHQLKPQHRISLEDDERILDTLNKSELDVWQMVKQNKVDVESMRELLVSLSEAHGSRELTSHTNNFLALGTSEERKSYLLLWKFKKLSNGIGEHIMSMDTICCAAARLRFDSSRSADQLGSGGPVSRWNKLCDIQKDGIVAGTEDRHLLVYELGFSRAYLEANYRLPSTPDHILVERRSPLSFDPKSNLQELTYKILVSCRNCRIYSIDQNYLPDRKSAGATAVRELVALGSSVIDMCWTAEDDGVSNRSLSSNGESCSSPNFIVACLDRRVYCFSSRSGQNKWIVELELPITCLVSLPIPRVSQDETCLVGVASQANRIDFYISSSGRIVDSIYLSDDYCQAMTFGRFGREDNCLCMTTVRGSLLILILKRTAKFANAQCLSSAASYASHVVTASCSRSGMQQEDSPASNLATSEKKLTLLKEPPGLPKPFDISKSTIVNPTDRALDQLQINHNCEQVVVKESIDSHLVMPKLQVPAKNRDFVDQIVHQARHSTAASKAFARDMLKLRDKVRSASEQQGEMDSYEDANRVTLTKVIGLGNIYRVSLSLRLKIPRTPVTDSVVEQGKAPEVGGSGTMTTQVILLIAENQPRCYLKPYKFEVTLEKPSESETKETKRIITDTTVEFKLTVMGRDPADGSLMMQEGESITLDVYVMPPRLQLPPNSRLQKVSVVRPAIVSSINIPIGQ